ncbi:uncharacterized protein LOC116300641 isoform X2 [Actinia tenebrosa]|uniref:Uncharacterized protein LOC116300641 isoform X2 n=1 Tax=Actinia tenebrosa TaxID=6105 RepID=A0A6P8IFA5_ACTTE|nr:uncharacterized protein LOC116300641 isoform X2 [Actinia tenebrosa]
MVIIKIVIFIATAFACFITTASRDYYRKGCYKDNWDRAIKGGVFKTFGWEDIASIDQCADIARSKGWKAFAVQYFGQCFTSPTAHLTYAKHGPSGICYKGIGNSFAMDVYFFGIEKRRKQIMAHQPVLDKTVAN